MQAERLRWRDVRATTPFRLTLLLGMLFLTGLWATLAFSYVLTAHELTARSDRILFARASALQTVPAADLPQRIRAEIANTTAGLSYFALESRDGELVTGNIKLRMPEVPGRPFSLSGRTGEHGPVRVLTVRTATGETIVLGRDISQISDLRRRLLLILISSGVAGTAMVLTAAVMLSLAPLRRVRDLERASRAIAGGDFSRRMPIAGRLDELDQFAGTVNRMVDEVSHVVAQVKSATDAIAHDLRTPLTRVRASLHRARQLPDLSSHQAIILDRSVADLDAVVERFGALLRIAELEASGRRSGLRRLELAPLLEEVADLYQPLAEENGIALSLSLDARSVIEADRELLFEAIGNLVDNAVKFARSRVMIRAGTLSGRAAVEIVDDGPGVPEDERDAVRRRFHRAKGASGVEGTGLGLAVVSAIVHLHGFTFELDDARPGLVARILMGPAE